MCYNNFVGAELLARATGEIREQLAVQGLTTFTAKWMLIVTWHRVKLAGGTSDSPVSLQIIANTIASRVGF